MRVTSAEFIKKYGAITDAALSEAVTITRNGRPRLVLLSADEYERLMKRDRKAVLTEDISEEDLAIIKAYEMGGEHAEFDDEMKGWNP